MAAATEWQQQIRLCRSEFGCVAGEISNPVDTHLCSTRLLQLRTVMRLAVHHKYGCNMKDTGCA